MSQAGNLAHLRAMAVEHQVRAETAATEEERRVHRHYAQHYETSARYEAERIAQRKDRP